MSKTIKGDGDPHSFPDIHYLDGKLFKYKLSNRYSIEEKQKIIFSLANLIAERANNQIKNFGIKALQVIASDAGSLSNFSRADNLFAEDILVAIAELVIEVNDDEIVNTVVNHIAEQMYDLIITNGWCPQGRVNRLHNVLVFLKDFIDGVHLPKK